MYRAQVVVVPIDGLDDPHHVAMLKAFDTKDTVYVSSADPAPMLVTVIGHYVKDGELVGHYHFKPQITKRVPQRFKTHISSYDKLMLGIGAVVIGFSIWTQML